MRSLFVEELRSKLIDKGFSQEEVGETIAYCIRHGFVDDATYARRFFEREIRQGRSYALAVQKYRQKNRANDAMEHLACFDRSEMDSQALSVCLKKWAKECASTEQKVRDRLLRRLVQKGFSWEMISRQLNDN